MTGNLAIDSHAPSYLSVHDIHSYYGESYIVQGVSFNVHEGEILALLGRNGAGKTSTLRSIARLDSPEVQRGEIWLDHQALHKMTSYQAATSGVSLVPEDRRIISGLTVEENLSLPKSQNQLGGDWIASMTFFHDWESGANKKALPYRAENSRCCQSRGP